MPKVIQGLEKRVGSITVSGKDPIDLDGPIQVGETVCARRGIEQIEIQVDQVQEDNTIIGRVTGIFDPQPVTEVVGVCCGDTVVVAMDFVHDLTRV